MAVEASAGFSTVGNNYNMFNNVDGKGFSIASREVKKMIKELKPLLWVFVIGLVAATMISKIAPNGLIQPVEFHSVAK